MPELSYLFLFNFLFNVGFIKEVGIKCFYLIGSDIPHKEMPLIVLSFFFKLFPLNLKDLMLDNFGAGGFIVADEVDIVLAVANHYISGTDLPL